MNSIPKHPFSMTIGPAKLNAPAGHTAHVVVFDTGRIPIHIAMHAEQITRVGGKCEVTGPARWAHPSPTAFTLGPGQHRVVSVAVDHATAAHPALGQLGTPHGSADLAVAATTALGHHGSVLLNGSVAAQGLVRFPGNSHMRPCVALSATTVHSSPLVGIIVAVVVVAIVGTATWLWRRRNNRRKLAGN